MQVVCFQWHAGCEGHVGSGAMITISADTNPARNPGWNVELPEKSSNRRLAPAFIDVSVALDEIWGET